MRQWVLDNLGLKLLSVFLATLLWAVVVGEQKVEVSAELPLELPIPPGLAVVNNAPESLEVSLRGPRTLVKSVVPREVSLQRLTQALKEGENLIPIRPDMVRVPRGIEVVEVLPQRLRVVLERLVEREIVVAPQIEGAPPRGYVVRQVIPVPDRITLVGPASEFKQLRRLRTLPVSVQGHTDSFTARVQVEPPGGQIRLREENAVDVRVEIGPGKS
jgi:hypothetical protein